MQSPQPAAIEELIGNVLYSCMEERRRAHEQYVPEHAMGYLLSGESQFTTGHGVQTHGAGSMGLVKRDMLVKTVKIPPPGGRFRSISINFSQDMLQRYSIAHNIKAGATYSGAGLHELTGNPFIRGFFDSLLPYFDHGRPLTPTMLELKTNEAIELLLQHDEELRNLLFDFSEPYKIDLAGYMGRHYTFNASMLQFARLTGRSLAAFKRDFNTTFGMPPGRWLQQKRLAEAYRLIHDEGRKPSDVYLDVGFENLSHFSFTFKKAYGKAPSML